MAQAVARGAVQARLKRKKLLERTQSLTEHSLDKAQRKKLLESLNENDDTKFLSHLIEGLITWMFYWLPFSFFEFNISGVAKQEDKKEDVEENEAVIPEFKPNFISERHFKFLGRYFTHGRKFDQTWMEAYYGFAKSNELEKLAEKSGGDSISLDSAQRSTIILLLNEFILCNQVYAS